MRFLHVVSVSGGKDSAATLLLAIERFGSRHVHPIFCDTGNEDEHVYDYLTYLEQVTGLQIVRLRADFSDQFPRKRMFIARDVRTRREYDTRPVFDADGNPIPQRDGRGQIVLNKKGEPAQKRRKIGGGRRVRWTNKAKRRALAALHPTGNPFLDLCMLKGRFPSRGAQFCTEELKRNVAVEYQLELMEQGYTVISWQGVRRDESDARKHVKSVERVGPQLWIYRPVAAWSAKQVFKYCASCGVKPNPLYLQDMSRVGCMYCINANKDEIRAVALRFPKHPRRLAAWEVIVSRCSKRGFSTFFHKLDGLRGSPAAIFEQCKIDAVLEWSKTSRGGRQFSLLTALEEPTDCSSSYGLCEASA